MKEVAEKYMEKTPLKSGKYNEDAKSSGKLTREQLMELEERDKTPRQKMFDKIITALPILMAAIALAEYLILPDINPNPMPHMYTCLMAGVLIAYTLAVIIGIIKEKNGNKKLIRRLRYKAPLYTAILILLTAFDYATIKTNIFTYPLVPCVNNIMYAAYTDYANLLNSALHTLKLMFEGYALGVILGLITGITCGYSRKVNYWVDPVIKFLGPIPIST